MIQNSPKPIRVLLADDHPIVRAGIRETLKEVPGVEVVGEASDGREAIEMVKASCADVVFMDISMPGLMGLEAIALTLKLSPKTVEYHRMQLMQRLDIFDIPGLVRFAVRTGLVSQES